MDKTFTLEPLIETEIIQNKTEMIAEDTILCSPSESAIRNILYYSDALEKLLQQNRINTIN